MPNFTMPFQTPGNGCQILQWPPGRLGTGVKFYNGLLAAWERAVKFYNGLLAAWEWTVKFYNALPDAWERGRLDFWVAPQV